MRRSFIIGLLTLGVLAGYGSGFAHMRHVHHPGGECHRGEDSASQR